MDSKIVLYIGRFLFGLGGENLAVACNTYASSWFKGEALNMAFGFQLAIVRVGSALRWNPSNKLKKFQVNFKTILFWNDIKIIWFSGL